MTPGRAIAGLVLALLIWAPASAQERGKPGEFDFYVLALSWSPSYCEAEGDQRRADEQCSRGRPFAFVTHGLWPQFERGYPRSCVEPAPRIPEDLIRTMLDVVPARGLVIHQWRAHGTCSGLEPRRYFELVRRATERIAIPERFRRLDDFTMVAPDEVEAAFRAANPGLASGMLAVTCDRRRLREVRICLSRELAFRACPEVARSACRLPRVVMPPVRGG